LPKVTPFPQTSHFAMLIAPFLKHLHLNILAKADKKGKKKEKNNA